MLSIISESLYLKIATSMLLVADYLGRHDINATFLPSHQSIRLCGASESSLGFRTWLFLLS